MDFAAFLRSLGLCPGRIVADGRWRRCPTDDHPRKRNGAYCLATDGRIGWAQNWARDAEPATWRADGEAMAPAPVDPARWRRQREAEHERERRAIQGARDYYRAAAPLVGGHPYLAAHDLDMAGCVGLRVDRHGWLVVPARRRGQVQTVQRIAPDGQKRFWPGAPVRAAAYVIGQRAASLTILCEGLATGLALYAAVPASRALATFSSGNLAPVAELLPPGMMVVAADNDHATEARIGSNPGVVWAAHAASLLGCGVAVPRDLEGSDWCDWRAERTAARMARRGPYEREGAVRRAVDAEIRAAVMREARLCGARREA